MPTLDKIFDDMLKISKGDLNALALATDKFTQEAMGESRIPHDSIAKADVDTGHREAGDTPDGAAV